MMREDNTATERHSSGSDLQHPAVTVCWRAFPEHQGKGHAVTRLLQAAGCQATQVGDGPVSMERDGVVWLQGNPHWYPTVWRQLATKPRFERPLTVVWHSEPLPPPTASRLPWPRLTLRELTRILLRRPGATDVYTNALRLRALARRDLLDLLVVSTRAGQQFLTERGIPAQWVPLGSIPSSGQDMNLRRDVDVLFIGDLSVPRRRRLIAQLRRQGVNLMAVGSWSDPAFWGENRTRLLNSAKIVLNIQRYPGELSGLRFILAMANKALAVSEPIYDPAPYVPGKHYVSASLADLPQLIRYYLAHEDERVAIADEGHRFVTQELTMVRSVARILELVRAQREQRPAEGRHGREVNE
jgi:glycosyl transferase family 1